MTSATLNNIQSKITKNSSTKQTKLHSNQSLPPRKHHQRKRLRLGRQHPLFAPRKGIHDGPEDTHAIDIFNDGIADAQRLVGIVSTKRFGEGNDRSQGDRCQSGRSGAIAESGSALDVVGDEVVRVLSKIVLSVSGVLGIKTYQSGEDTVQDFLGPSVQIVHLGSHLIRKRGLFDGIGYPRHA